MKYYLCLSLSLLLFSCSKKEAGTPDYPDVAVAEPKYDTVPKDSFSAGAISVDVARQIRISSVQYQDSLKKALQAQAEIEAKRAELSSEKKPESKDEKLKSAEQKVPETKEKSKEEKPDKKE